VRPHFTQNSAVPERNDFGTTSPTENSEDFGSDKRMKFAAVLALLEVADKK
jgi:hypothetical protein